VVGVAPVGLYEYYTTNLRRAVIDPDRANCA